MKYSYTWLKEFVPRLPAPEKLASLIARHAFEVESVVKSGRDTILDVAVLANRLPDAAGHIGFSREIAAITKLAGKFPDTKPPKSVGKKFLDAAIKPRDLAPRYLGALVSVKIQPSPAWLRERLTTLDIHTINNVVDITNYVMLECGHPLHAFDHSKIRGKKMTVRLAREGEKLETLDGSHLVLPGGVIVIQDAERIIDLAGIMGGANSAVDSKTKTIFLQAANFDPARIHRAARKLGKRTDAAIRYAAGLDPNAAEVALALAIELLKELAAGEVLGVLDIYPDRVVPARILFHPARASAVLGTAIPEKEMRAIFERLGFDVETAPRVALRNQKRATLGATGWTVVVPTARRDIA
ncbi:MAG: hypothetical protein HYS44_03710, partial [Candidatus Niyogibacteria bacterium]|nr:hypothetical protein [Candidatus Niyogibacteria bacterium]